MRNHNDATQIAIAQMDDRREHERLRVERTEGRDALEALRDIYGLRLHQQAGDLDATHGLRLVIAKLQRTSFGPAVVTASS
jgi:hypothetical protein